VPALAVIGNVACDLVDGGPPRVGGGPFYAAKALRILGRPARILTRCSLEHRDTLLPDLIALGVPVTWREAATTSTFGIRYDGDRRFMQVEEVGHVWTPEDVRDASLAHASAVHVAPLLRSDFPPETLAELAHGRRLSLDGQGLVRPGRTGELVLDADFDPAVLRHLTVLKLAEEEAEAVLGDVDPRAVAELGVPEVLVTLGPRGSIVYTDGDEVFVPANEVKGVDPTGAGDAYSTAYLAARSQRAAPVAAARRATALVEGMLAGRLR
jgi:sugar/nucleoside kinase (ribokinase family)